jgi:protein O-mannosyl-transferase
MRGSRQITDSENSVGREIVPSANGSDSRFKFEYLALILIALATVAAYSPVLFNFFAGDDFVHLTWLRQAVHQPELIWRNFHSSWLDGTTTKFYRPLISVFMVTDYLGWGINGLGFHITNLLFHLAGTGFLYLIIRELQPEDARHRHSIWALATAAIFALYPLHTEAVSWITGRVDSIVTAFTLASIWCYMKWRSQKIGWLAASIGFFILGLLSKEMAITIPAVLVVYELSRGFDIKRIILKTMPYWAVVAGYFVVRRLALGTFVGGYDDSLLFISDPKAFVLGWAHAFRMSLVPLNKELFGAHHIATKVWEIFLAATVILSGINLFKNKQYRPAIFFVCAWLVLCLVPVYKIFAIADDLQGSRLAYLATAPIAALLAFGLSSVPSLRIATVLTSAFAALCSFILWNNNQPWREAGLQANAISSALNSTYANVSGDPQVLIIGLPDQIRGAYVCRNALWGMTKSPQLSRDIQNCLMVNGFEPIQPFGFLKPSMIENRGDVHVYQWLSGSKELKSLTLGEQNAISKEQQLSGPIALKEDSASKRSSAMIETVLPGWNIDFVRVDLTVDEPGTTATGADLLYANNITPELQLGHRTHTDMPATAGKQSLIFSLHSLPDWAFGTGPAKLKLLLPPGCKATIDSVTAVPPAVLTPQITFANSGYMGTKGYLHLGKSAPAQPIVFDSGAIPGAAATAIEVTRANLLFEEQNGQHFSKVSKPLVRLPLKGSIVLDPKEFTAPGIYEIRLWAKDNSDKVVGVSSDHIVISVDP